MRTKVNSLVASAEKAFSVIEIKSWLFYTVSELAQAAGHIGKGHEFPRPTVPRN